jgi:6-pyruvoyltetrahydropterin/6-carboxytetrahydropterin synthase
MAVILKWRILKLIEVTKIIEWDMGHRVPNHRSKCRNPHGHRYRLEMTVAGDLIDKSGDSSEGMVIDFGEIKSLMKDLVHDKLDHGFMYYKDDDAMKCLVDGAFKAGGWLLIEVDFIPTAENIVKWCYDQLKGQVEFHPGPTPTGVTITKLRLYETPNSWADYRP